MKRSEGSTGRARMSQGYNWGSQQCMGSPRASQGYMKKPEAHDRARFPGRSPKDSRKETRECRTHDERQEGDTWLEGRTTVQREYNQVTRVQLGPK